MGDRVVSFPAPPGGAGTQQPRALVGAKGLGLLEMTRLGLPVPPGFVLTTEVCRAYYAAERLLPEGLEAEAAAAMRGLEAGTGRAFGAPDRPLLVSVRSGAPSSMPGMLDTVLNLGLNADTAAGMSSADSPSFAWECFRRFVRNYGEVVLGLDPAEFDQVRGGEAATPEPTPPWREAFATAARGQIPWEPWEQLWGAVRAVLDSWQGGRAVAYRRLHDIPDDPGTAVTVQAMVFGNAGPNSAAGVAFTRHPTTGASEPFGEYLPGTQGDDVVSGVRTPLPLNASGGGAIGPTLETAIPTAYRELVESGRMLERQRGAMQDVEFTIERGRLWLLQTRAGITSPHAALRIAVDMAVEGIVAPADALRRLDPESLAGLLHPAVRADVPNEYIARGLAASPGAATGAVALSADEAAALSAKGEKAVLVLAEIHPREAHGIHAAAAVVTSRGGATSHAALVARGAGRPCVVGAGNIVVDAGAGSFSAGGQVVRRGDVVTVDGTAGGVSLGALELEMPRLGPAFDTVLGWADASRRLGVRANASSPHDINAARKLGAESIGLLRTEVGFLETETLDAVRRYILAADAEQKATALGDVLPLQRAAYAQVFAQADGMPVILRLLDLPPSELLPASPREIAVAAAAAGVAPAAAKARAEALAETNPMLGHRGCRLAISWPDLYAVQIRAILEEAAAAGVTARILVPMAVSAREFEAVRDTIAETAENLPRETRAAPSYSVGALIELPRAALQAGRIAESADFLSFGTNNLTQTTFGVGREDAAAFLERYRGAELLGGDPFATLDEGGVGALLEIAVKRSRAVRPGIEIGVCGEHGGDPDSIRIFHRIGLDYVSCSPYRIPVARLAAAQTALDEQ